MTAFLKLRRGMLVAGVALTAALAAGTVGCGSDDEGTAATGADGADTTSVEADPPAPPTKAEYIAAADEICTRFDKKQEVFKVRSKLTDQIVASQSTEGADEVADAVDAVADQRQDLTDALRELEPPASGRPSDYFAAREKSIEVTRDLAETWDDYGKGKADGPTVDAALLAEVDALEVNAKQGEKYGFEVCSAPIKDKK